jgi:hypothetical protein
VEGGSLNDYEYAGGDPVDHYDLDGLVQRGGFVARGGIVPAKEARQILAQSRVRARVASMPKQSPYVTKHVPSKEMLPAFSPARSSGPSTQKFWRKVAAPVVAATYATYRVDNSNDRRNLPTRRSGCPTSACIGGR